ncbi:MAG: hypothetical protein OEZ43_19560 [Gammaproteobacteria bacterium]|nr:hypothetical protein [Gammaproteobacteria bacterium]
MKKRILLIHSRFLILFIVTQLLSACAIAHHVQIGDIDNRHPDQRFEITVNEYGANIREAAHVAQSLGRHNQMAKEFESIANIVALFQMGPTTGKRVYNDVYAKDILERILLACPSGDVTGLTAVRASRYFSFASGEFVQIIGYCRDKGQEL